MEGQPPRGPEDGEPFPSFDPDYARQQARPQPQGGGPVTPPPGAGRPTPQASPWIVGLAVAAVSVTVSIIAFGLFASSGGTAATTTTTTTLPDEDTDTTLPDDGTDTTLPDEGPVTAPPIVASGDPVPVAELTMHAGGIGEFTFGSDGGEVLGRFAATFGTPTDDSGFMVGSGSWGECPGDSIRVVRWGPLNLVVEGDGTSGVFVSYRIDLRYGGVTSEPTDMTTLSGVRVGDKVETFESIYQDLDIVYRVHPTLGTTFELRSTSQGDILLWGPVESQSPDSLVTGIYSPDSCGAATSD